MKNKDGKLCAPVELEVATGKAVNKSDKKSKQFMANWLTQGSNKKRKSDEEEFSSNKNAKKECTTSTPSSGMDIANNEVSQEGFGQQIQKMVTGMVGQGLPSPPEKRFRTQLETLTSMGFADRQANIQALTATNGDVNASIDRLLNSGPADDEQS